MVPTSPQDIARKNLLRIAQAETKKEAIVSLLDTRIRDIGSFTLGRGKLFGHESDDSFARRLSSSEPVKALLQKAFIEESMPVSGLERFARLLKENLHISLASTHADPAERERKAESIARAVVSQIKDAPEMHRCHLVARAKVEALAYQTGNVEIQYGGVAEGLLVLAEEKGVTVSPQSDARSIVFEKFQTDIMTLNAQKCQRARADASDMLGELTRNLCGFIKPVSEVRSNTKSQEIARRYVEQCESRSDAYTPASLKHPLNALWVAMSKGSDEMIPFAQLRAQVVSSLALELHHTKGYDEAESIRKAEHIFSYMAESLDAEAVQLYAEAYRSCLPVNMKDVARLDAELQISWYSAPVFPEKASAEQLASHQTYLLDQSLTKLNSAAPARETILQTEADRRGIATGSISAENFIKAIASNKDLALFIHERTVFGLGAATPTEEAKLASYRSQLNEALSTRLASLPDSERRDVWLDKAAKKLAAELSRLYPEDMAAINKRRNVYGDRQEGAAAIAPELFLFTELETRQQARQAFDESLGQWCTAIRSKVDLRPTAPDIRTVEPWLNRATFNELAQNFFLAAPDNATAADFRIALNCALDRSLSGTPGMDQHLQSTHEKREKAHAWIASVLDRFCSLEAINTIREPIQIRRAELGLCKIDGKAKEHMEFREAQRILAATA